MTNPMTPFDPALATKAADMLDLKLSIPNVSSAASQLRAAVAEVERLREKVSDMRSEAVRGEDRGLRALGAMESLATEFANRCAGLAHPAVYAADLNRIAAIRVELAEKGK